MKTIKITADNEISIIELDFQKLDELQEAIGGYIETVHTQRMFDFFKCPMLMIVDEDGHEKNLAYNKVGSYFYETDKHGWPILGDFILSIPEGEDLIGLEDAAEWKDRLVRIFSFLTEEEE